MKPTALLIVMLMNQGYWFSDQEATIAIRWAARGELPGADLAWDLMLGPVSVAKGQEALKPDNGPTTITVKAPSVRVRSELRWTYRLIQRDGGKELERGDIPVYVFPRNLTESWPRVIGEKTLIVWDAPEGLPKLLKAAQVPHTAVADGADLALRQSDIALVGADQLGDSPFAQSPLIGQAEAGCSVMVFAQTRPDRLGGYALAERAVSGPLKWKLDHPLLAGLDIPDLQSWLATPDLRPRAIQLPVDEPALEVAWWPRETPGEAPAPIDALLVVKSIGAGRIVLCQIPLGAWDQDPRSQLFLTNALNYLLTRPQPTLPPSQRQGPKEPEPIKVPTIEISPGGKP